MSKLEPDGRIVEEPVPGVKASYLVGILADAKTIDGVRNSASIGKEGRERRYSEQLTGLPNSSARVGADAQNNQDGGDRCEDGHPPT